MTKLWTFRWQEDMNRTDTWRPASSQQTKHGHLFWAGRFVSVSRCFLAVRGSGLRSTLSSGRRTAGGRCRPASAPRSAAPAGWHRTRRRPATGCPPAGSCHAPRRPSGPSASADCAPAAGEPSPSTPATRHKVNFIS